MAKKLAFASLIALAPVLAYTQSDQTFECTHAGLTRRVEIAYQGTPVPCEVRYYKDTEAPGAPEVLWSAQHAAGYCEARAREFLERLRGWGWDCEGSAAPPPADDTGVLGADEPAAPTQ
jgi:hypothetical protein